MFIGIYSFVVEIQTPIALIVHPKMNSGKESVAPADFGMQMVNGVRDVPVALSGVALDEAIPFAIEI